MDNNIWQLQDVKSKFSQVINRALVQGVQVITRWGRKTAVVIPFDEYERLTRQGGRLSQFLLASPLPDSDLNIERHKSMPRHIENDS